MIQDVVFVLLGLVGLYYGGEWLVEGSARLARSFGVSTLVIGLTVVAFGTSTPELLVSLSAAVSGSSDIAVGNVIGSNIANIGLILGLTGLVFPVAVHVAILRREIPILLIVTAATALIVMDGSISRLDGGVLFTGLIVFNVLMIYLARQDHKRGELQQQEAEAETEEPPIPPTRAARSRELLRICTGLGVLLLGAQLMVSGSVSIARDLGVSELVIGITLVAVGTSLPELATSLAAALNKQSDIAIGNVVGSNIYNLLGILGITAIVKPITVQQRVIDVDGPVMMGFTFLLLPFVWNRKISRNEGIFLLTLYIGFTLLTFAR